jgi:hypothetical protein
MSDYAEQLRQLADWVDQSVLGLVAETQRIGLEDVDTELLRDAATHLEGVSERKNT